MWELYLKTYIVCAVRSSPSLGIHGAVETLCHAILGQYVGIEECTGLVRTIRCRVSLVVGRLCIAGTCTCARSVALRLREWVVFESHKGIMTLCVQWCLNGTAIADRSIEAVDGGRGCVLVVSVGTRHENLERSTILSSVGGSFGRDWDSPGSTLVICGTSRHGAID